MFSEGLYAKYPNPLENIANYFARIHNMYEKYCRERDRLYGGAGAGRSVSSDCRRRQKERKLHRGSEAADSVGDGRERGSPRGPCEGEARPRTAAAACRLCGCRAGNKPGS